MVLLDVGVCLFFLVKSSLASSFVVELILTWPEKFGLKGGASNGTVSGSASLALEVGLLGLFWLRGGVKRGGRKWTEDSLAAAVCRVSNGSHGDERTRSRTGLRTGMTYKT